MSQLGDNGIRGSCPDIPKPFHHLQGTNHEPWWNTLCFLGWVQHWKHLQDLATCRTTEPRWSAPLSHLIIHSLHTLTLWLLCLQPSEYTAVTSTPTAPPNLQLISPRRTRALNACEGYHQLVYLQVVECPDPDIYHQYFLITGSKPNNSLPNSIVTASLPEGLQQFM